MKCSEFLDKYTDFRDGVLAPREGDALRAHVAGCVPCRRYDRVVTRGVGLLRALPATRPDPDFRARLRHSIYALEEERRRRRLLGTAARAVPLLGTLGVLGALLTALTLRESVPVVELPPIVAGLPSHASGPVGSALLPGARASVEARSWPAVPAGPGTPGTFASAARLPAAARAAPVRRFPAPEFSRGANELLYRNSSLYLRYREPGLVRTTGLR